MTESMRDIKPKLRPIDAFPVELEGERKICLRDRTGIADGPLIFPFDTAIAFLLESFDGKHSLGDIQLLFTSRFREIILTRQIAELVHLLDQHGYMEGPTFEQRLEDRRRHYLELPERPPTLTFGSTPAEALGELKAQFRRDRDHPFSPDGLALDIQPGSVRAILAPHIDYFRGGYAYACAYQALATGSAADVFVILGTIHHSMSIPFAATRKPYQTPLGSLPVAEDFLEALQARLPKSDLLADEFAHASEHSIELQVLYLQHVLKDRAAGIRIVPILVDSFAQDIARRRSPRRRPRVARFLDALRETLADAPRPVCLIGGVDLSHVGPRFGAQEIVTDAQLEDLARRDQAMLGHIEMVDAEAFIESFFEDGNASNVCSVAPIYCILDVLAGQCRGKILRYGQALDSDRGGVVTFASVAFQKNP